MFRQADHAGFYRSDPKHLRPLVTETTRRIRLRMLDLQGAFRFVIGAVARWDKRKSKPCRRRLGVEGGSVQRDPNLNQLLVATMGN